MNTSAGAPRLVADTYPTQQKQAAEWVARLLQARLSRRIFVAGAIAGSLGLGMAIGQAVAVRPAHIAGACVALDMAEAHGALDEPRRKRIIHSLTSLANPQVERFQVTRSEMLRTCSQLKASRLPAFELVR